MTASAPIERDTSSLAGLDAAATTFAPRRCASSTAADPTPPAAPRTATHSPGCTRATLTSAWNAVSYVTPYAAAAPKSTSAGTLRSDRAGATTSSANAPTNPPPRTRSPTDSSATDGPTAATVPANSLPGMNGSGADAWYRLPTMSASG